MDRIQFLFNGNFHCVKMRYSIDPIERRYVKDYGFLSFARNLNNKYGQKLADSAKKSATDAFKMLIKEQFKKQLKQLEI